VTAAGKEFSAYARKLGKGFRGKVEQRVGMKRLTTFKVGGLAEVVVRPADGKDIERAVALARDMELAWRIFGEGSNLLVLDGGIREVMINLSDALSEVEFQAPARGDQENGPEKEIGPRITAKLGAGVRLMSVVKECQQHGLSGLEWAAGIPGTVGGALAMNAGSMGSSMADVVEWVEWMSPEGGVQVRRKDELEFEYRRLHIPEEAVITACGIRLQRDDKKAVRERIVAGLKKRRQTQPLQHPSAGSVFKNPPGDYAGRLIEAAGLKGKRVGDAQISDVHANFIVNRGRARSKDVTALIDLAKSKVAEEFGVELELEVEIIGEELA